MAEKEIVNEETKETERAEPQKNPLLKVVLLVGIVLMLGAAGFIGWSMFWGI